MPCKNIQWVFGGTTYSEDAFVVMLGPLHTEMALIILLGEWLTDGGCTTALTEAGVCTSCRADSVLKASHVTLCTSGNKLFSTSINCCLSAHSAEKAYQK